ncbi:hypothetical protein ACFSL6_03965 [Paenibacillus thailandensis]|uniref:hypothetical protein n=1 Tax=Paenibacillus thailandensis TaxID=393250 RepID=UPI00363F1A97
MLQIEAKTVKIPLGNAAEGLAVFGPQDRFLRLVQDQTEARIASREAEIVISGERRRGGGAGAVLFGDAEARPGRLFADGTGYGVRPGAGPQMQAEELLDLLRRKLRRRTRQPVRVKTIGSAITSNDSEARYRLTASVSGGGTGKTYLAVVLAVAH